MNVVSIQRAPTLFLKAVLAVIALAVLALLILSFPSISAGIAVAWRVVPRVLLPAVIGVYATVVPFFLALWQAYLLLRNIDAGEAFSESSVTALKHIKYCAIAMTALYALALPFAYVFAELDDAPGLILISTAFACAPLVVATFAAVLEALVQSAVAMKAEQDLIV
jgi:hypothetical protein